MNDSQNTMAERVALAAMTFQEQRTGHRPEAVTVVLSNDTLVVTFRDALTRAEKVLATSRIGAARVQEFHRELFANSSLTLRQEIKRLTGVGVREAAAEIEPVTGAVIHAFAAGTMVQVFLLAHGITDQDWNGATPRIASDS